MASFTLCDGVAAEPVKWMGCDVQVSPTIEPALVVLRPEFQDITVEVTALFGDPLVGPPVAARQEEMREADAVEPVAEVEGPDRQPEQDRGDPVAPEVVSEHPVPAQLRQPQPRPSQRRNRGRR